MKKVWNTPELVKLEVSKTMNNGQKRGNLENNTPSNDPHGRRPIS